MKLRFFLACMFILLFSTKAFGIGILVPKSDSNVVPLEIKSHTVEVIINDQIARTFVDEVFVNHTARDLEGTFHFPLPESASISNYAMYVGDELVEGEIVERRRAAQVYKKAQKTLYLQGRGMNVLFFFVLDGQKRTFDVSSQV